ncbi:HAMP domain-containing protein [bacterium]|nr:HAMP domain-containing protein [bacterium]
MILVSLAVPVVVEIYLIVQNMQATIRFSQLETMGNTYQRPMMDMLDAAGRLRLALDLQQNVGPNVQAIDKAIEELKTNQAAYGQDLQFTKEGLAIRKREQLEPQLFIKRWEEIKTGLKTNPDAQMEPLAAFLNDIRGIITHSGDTSNLILDPDLDSYYSMDVTLLALPQTIHRLADIMHEVHTDMADGITPDEQTQLAIRAQMLQEADGDRIKASLETSMNEDPNFYGVLPGFNDAIKPALQTYTDANQAYIAALRALAAGQPVSKEELLEKGQAAYTAANKLWVISANELDGLLNVRIADFNQQKITALATSGAAMLFALFIFWLVGRNITKSVTGLAERMNVLASGNRDVEIPFTEEKSEIGVIAVALEKLKQTAIAADRMQQEQAEEQARKEARARKLLATIDSFKTTASNAIGDVAGQAKELDDAAERMREMVGTASKDSKSVAEFSEQTSGNVNAVAAAAEQMSASVREIASQVSRSTQAVEQAVSSTTAADSAAKTLAEASQAIGDIVQLIQDIANQINLLALNATIESARAGEYGKGFAVVASEVKNLAQQTTKATEDVAAQIERIQGVATDVVGSMDKIKTSINQVSQYASGIASAIEEQSAVTNEISRNMMVASTGVKQITDNISHISDMNNSAYDTTQEVQRSASVLSDHASQLKEEIGNFIKEVSGA